LAGRTIPPTATQAPGNYVTSALWNTQITNGVQSFTWNPPVFKGIASTTQSVASASSYTTLILTSAVTDTEGGWASGAPTLYTVKTPGRYLIMATCTVGGASGTDATPRGIGIFVNGASVRTARSASGGTSWQGNCSITTYLAVGTTVSFSLMQQSGASQSTDISSGSVQPCLELVWLGAN
jgi:hypothetical protein